jgi:hypothetical protein
MDIKIARRGEIDTPNTPVDDRSISVLGTCISIKGGGIKLILRAQTSPLSEMIRSCKCFTRVSKMSTLTYSNRMSSVIIKNVIFLNIIYIINPASFYWNACTKHRNWAVIYWCVRGIDFTSSCDFDIGFGNCPNSMIFVFFILSEYCIQCIKCSDWTLYPMYKVFWLDDFVVQNSYSKVLWF